MPPHLLLLGHRGARNYAPENTFAAFDLALEHGADGFEFDLRSTRSRQILICHDPGLNRLSIRRSTLKQLQAHSGAPEEFPPCLEDVLQRYASTAFMNLEVKVRGIERLVYRIFRNFAPQRGYFISSFWPSVLRELHRIDSTLILGTLSQTRWQLRRWDRLPAAYVVPNYRLLSRRLVEEIHAAKKLVVTWTVNEPKKMLRAAELGVDGIISDDTKLLRETLGGSR
ncbi:MAG TPA: glycerophosphodiester phosphodiesterase [Candidatus Angelobacter sp.]|nr:glycerophosphodiester phosphodiesterase [Candidatus Angelobacter sp.]